MNAGPCALWDLSVSAGIAALMSSGTLPALYWLPHVNGRTFLIGTGNLFCSVYLKYIYSFFSIFFTENFCKHFHHSLPPEFSIGSNIITFKAFIK